jgi:peptidyl-prolyl cis-trans isomerase C
MPVISVRDLRGSARKHPFARPAFGLVAAAALLAAMASPALAQTPPAAPATPPAAAQPAPVRLPPETVVARVAGVDIRQSDLDQAAAELRGELPPMGPDQLRDYLITYVSDMILVTREAAAQKLDQTPAFQQRLGFLRNKVLMEDLLETTAKAAVTPDAMRKVYDEAVKSMAGQQEVRARHILVETEDEAKKVQAELKGGGDFAALAKARSKDPGSANEGGDLDYFTKDQMVPEFADVAFKLNVGQVSDPVKTQFGWHIIRVDDKRNRPAPTFEQVQGQIEQYLVRQAQAGLITRLREGNAVQRLPLPEPKKN